MHGFKSFPKKTEIPFTKGINVILGPNGSGKSNVSDALCFVLGRLSVKSMRATKAKNLIFLGSKIAGPSKEASVEMVFDNTDNAFSIDAKEVSIKRIVRRNGQSLYKINNQTKTRQEILALLAQAGVDPNGFNIILQGEIQNFVNMHTEERRKIIEEVSGIAIYESRKEKSLKELNKTEEKLKEVSAILKERTAYLNNLEKERQQALRYKKLEKDVQKYKASIINFDLNKNKKETDKLNSEIEKKNKEIAKVKKVMVDLRSQIENYQNKIAAINATIQKETGLEQERLNQEIANLRADIAGTSVKIENYENKLSRRQKEKQALTQTIRASEVEIAQMNKSSGNLPSKGKEKSLERKKQELEKIENLRKKFYAAKSELKSMKTRIDDKNKLYHGFSNEITFLLNQTKAISRDMFDKHTEPIKLEKLQFALNEKKSLAQELAKKEKALEKIASTKEYDIETQNKLVANIAKIDICPVCKSKITPDHVHDIGKEVAQKIATLEKQIATSDKELAQIYKRRDMLNEEIENLKEEIKHREADILKLASINEKKEHIKNLNEKTTTLQAEMDELEKLRKKLEVEVEENATIDQQYETLKIEVQEIALRSEENVDSEIAFKKREVERAKIQLKQLASEEEELTSELKSVNQELEENEMLLDKKRAQEEALTQKFNTLMQQRDSFNTKIRECELEITRKQNDVHLLEQNINDCKIEKARFDAIVENLEIELLGFTDVEILKASRDSLVVRLEKTQSILATIGTVNLRSLEVYDSVKAEYDAIHERVEIIAKEKNGILKIIHEIDVKKKKTFLKTLDSLNDIFSRNFSQLSTKGEVFLELENRKDPFDGGVNIIVKTGHGKYFDVKSLSGGEQTLVALSLIFAIQEHKPYYFYILDEIDAALDKRNSERLANLLKKYMQKGQYIVITHNDEVISNATNLFGVSMHDGISKIVSLKL